ncbi:hypothetical protein SIN08_15915 [Chelativorans sp. M5D2P16]|nr:hypothetical protein [Chelativorans sp. M5D2P16]MDZ5698730.1 hypothetical protein [Chelativorans sp. M5D2P16]
MALEYLNIQLLLDGSDIAADGGFAQAEGSLDLTHAAQLCCRENISEEAQRLVHWGQLLEERRHAVMSARKSAQRDGEDHLLPAIGGSLYIELVVGSERGDGAGVKCDIDNAADRKTDAEMLHGTLCAIFELGGNAVFEGQPEW